LRKITLGLAGALAATIPAQASAAEFDGPFVGAQVGWQSEKMQNPETALGAVPIDDSKQAVTGGIFAGYDKRIDDRVVIGAEAGLDLASDDEVQTTVLGTSYTISPKYSVDLSARAGFLVDPSTLVYARGGYTGARTRTTIADPLGTQIESGSRDGWLLGGGVERQVKENASARLEYRFSRYGGSDDDQFDRHRVLAGLSYRF
jgi:outer membrane immunogenic protein